MVQLSILWLQLADRITALQVIVLVLWLQGILSAAPDIVLIASAGHE